MYQTFAGKFLRACVVTLFAKYGETKRHTLAQDLHVQKIQKGQRSHVSDECLRVIDTSRVRHPLGTFP